LFVSLVERVREESMSYGIPSIDYADAFALYAAAFATTARFRRGVVVVDAGSGIGYSAIWISKAVDDACQEECRIIAVEHDSRLAGRLRENLTRYPWRRLTVNVVAGDAVEVASSIPRVHFAFVDIEKHSYPAILRRLWPRIPSGGMIAFHNAYMPPPPREFYTTVSALEGAVYTIAPSTAGLLLIAKS